PCSSLGSVTKSRARVKSPLLREASPTAAARRRVVLRGKPSSIVSVASGVGREGGTGATGDTPGPAPPTKTWPFAPFSEVRALRQAGRKGGAAGLAHVSPSAPGGPFSGIVALLLTPNRGQFSATAVRG